MIDPKLENATDNRPENIDALIGIGDFLSCSNDFEYPFFHSGLKEICSTNDIDKLTTRNGPFFSDIYIRYFGVCVGVFLVNI